MSDSHTQGAVPLDSAAYVVRQFEERVVENVLAGNWVVLLGPRQHGKSSGLLRIQRSLRDSDLPCALVDLQARPPAESFEDVLEWIARRVAKALEVDLKTKPKAANRADVGAWLELAAPKDARPVVIILDEAANIPSQWIGAFFGQLRAIKNEAAASKAGALPRRLRLIFAGTFKQEELIDDLNSPFNVSERVETEDLTFEEVNALCSEVLPEIDENMVKSVFDLVGGQPYLVQVLVSAIASASSDQQAALDEASEALRTGANAHFESVFGPVLASAALTEMTRRLVEEPERGIAVDPASADGRYLSVLGLAGRQEGRLVIRNKLYLEFALASPQLALGDAPAVASAQITLVAASTKAFDPLVDDRLREIASSNERAAIECYNSRCFRNALVAFGAALEAVLLDLFLRTSNGEIETAVTAAESNGTDYPKGTKRLNPETWGLFQLISAATEFRGAAKLDVPASLQQWRNLVHPAVILRDYRRDDELEPEARTASGLFAMLLRDLGAQ